ncbi:isochorismatase family protein [Finegoldia magna]|uniref:isochorismatase family protein n=1 Tax=Finegoldia magna TaxID=1260 RepID=UPI002914E685|nr:isochorismatase family protein [Finegoldia magna]MDU5200362.1 isochorismatase family protein [Finegoldia magna]MDU6775484.1 isochorismatase family protein [Finegoldia magna]
MEKFNVNKDDMIILLIDLQEKLAPVLHDNEYVLNHTKAVLEMARIYDIPVITTRQYPKGLGDTVECLKEYETKVFDKVDFTAKLDDVMNEIEKTGRKQIVVVGAEAHICVYQTIRDLIDEYKMIVLEDCVTSRRVENKMNAIQNFREMDCLVINSETLIFDILKRAGSPEFKTLSKLIK